jgi:cytochrome P450
VLQEVEKVIGKDKPLDYTPTHDEMKQFNFLLQVIKESLRLYPSVAAIPLRKTSEDTTLGTTFLPKGSLLRIVTLVPHLSKQYFANPDIFDPDHFSEANVKKMHPYTYFPFGGGSRVCKWRQSATRHAADNVDRHRPKLFSS